MVFDTHFPSIDSEREKSFFIGAEIIVGICKNTDMSKKSRRRKLRNLLFFLNSNISRDMLSCIVKSFFPCFCLVPMNVSEDTSQLCDIRHCLIESSSYCEVSVCF